MKRAHVPYVTIVIMVICTAVYALQAYCGYADDTEGMILFGAYYKPFILAGEFWRLLSVGFVHASIWHLLINMMSLYTLGQALENSIGRWKYLLILMGSVLGGSLFLFAGSGNTVAVGLSAGLYGLMAAYTLIIVRSGGFRVPRVRNALLSTLLINLLINFMPGVSWIAHLGGAVTGLILSGILLPDRKRNNMRRNYCVCGMVLLLCTSVLAYNNASISSDEIYLLSDYRILCAEKKVLPEWYIENMARKLDTIYSTGNTLHDAVLQGEA